MLKNETFISCYGVAFNDDQISECLISDMNHWDEHGFGPWMWFENNFHYVGRAGLKTFVKNNQLEIELTYAINPQYWGKGIAVKIAQCALDYGFNVVKLKSIICFTRKQNSQSRRVIEKLGFRYEYDFVYHNLLHCFYRIET